jgi:hypothetical protein
VEIHSSKSGFNYASWTFRKAEKFFDVVTYTGDGSTRNVPILLAAVPGVIIVKKLALSTGWFIIRSLGTGSNVYLKSQLLLLQPRLSLWGTAIQYNFPCKLQVI